MKIGIFGGSFDPPHIGHLEVARACRAGLELDEVLWIPANQNPLKSFRASARPEDRLEMVRLMLQDEPAMAVSDMEITRGGRSFMIDTVDELSFVTSAEYWLLMGTDGLARIPEWRSVNRLLKSVRLGIVVRPPHTIDQAKVLLSQEFQEYADFIPMPPNATSSTDIRKRVALGDTVANLLHPAVLRYIQNKKLYTTS
jgi:nicotinate-nucleotide adenylyltransferase